MRFRCLKYTRLTLFYVCDLRFSVAFPYHYTNCAVPVSFQQLKQQGRAHMSVFLNASRKSRLKYAYMSGLSAELKYPIQNNTPTTTGGVVHGSPQTFVVTYLKKNEFKPTVWTLLPRYSI